MVHDLALGHSKELRAVERDVEQDQDLLADLHRVTMSNSSLHREHTMVSNIMRGLEVVFKMKNPWAGRCVLAPTTEQGGV